MNVNIPITQMANGSFAPATNGVGIATVSYKQDQGQPKTAIVAFNGMNQAVITFNEFNQATSYTMLNPGATMQDQESVENIARYISSQPTVH